MIDLDNLPPNEPDAWKPDDRASKSLTLEEQTWNAALFTMYFAYDLGNAGYPPDMQWSPEAVAGILGNITVESSINPWRWQNDTEDPANGFGLVQWTPYTNYSNFIQTGDLHGENVGEGYNPEIWGEWNGENGGYLETETIAAERRYDKQWIATAKYNYDFHEFTTRRDTPSEMAEAFLLDYERPADPNASLVQRQEWAEYWYTEVVLPIYGMGGAWWYWLYGYVFSKKYMGRWYL